MVGIYRSSCYEDPMIIPTMWIFESPKPLGYINGPIPDSSCQSTTISTTWYKSFEVPRHVAQRSNRTQSLHSANGFCRPAAPEKNIKKWTWLKSVPWKVGNLHLWFNSMKLSKKPWFCWLPTIVHAISPKYLFLVAIDVALSHH